MNSPFRYIIWFVFAGLITANLFIFVSGMKLSEKINYFEKEVKQLHHANIDLEKKVYQANSLQFAASKAAELDFSKKAELFYLENLGYALKK